jgi:hypothetical protein
MGSGQRGGSSGEQKQMKREGADQGQKEQSKTQSRDSSQDLGQASIRARDMNQTSITATN